MHKSGQTYQAQTLYKEILKQDPTQPNANYNLGVIEYEGKRIDNSLPFFKAALEAEPHEAQYWLSYIIALIEADKYHDAEFVLSHGIKAGLSGKETEAVSSLLRDKLEERNRLDNKTPPKEIESQLIKLFSESRYEEIENKILSLVHDYPNWLVGWKILSDTVLIQGKDARLPALRALELNPSDAKEHCYYGLILKSHGDLRGAASAFERATQLKPDYAAAYNNLGIVKKDLGNLEEGLRYYRHALDLNPGYASCYSNLLFCLTHSEKIETKALFEEHCKFSHAYETSLATILEQPVNDHNPQRCLKVGFVSADFRDHSIAYFFEPILKHLSISLNLSLYAYSNSAQEDSTTLRMRGKFKYWNSVSTMSDEDLARKIRDDGIDILVDLSGHTAGNRLLTFAMKPAPIQVSWLGYLSTTGLKSMDYYLADSYLLPPNKLDDQFTEKLVQLPANAPFMPSDVAPEVSDLPALRKGYVTFACFNRPNKITSEVVKLWARLLKSVPNSKMLLGAMPNDGSYDAMIEWFHKEGIARDRLEFHPRSFMKNYLKLHHEVDICLDTFPSNGVTTTCHAVWMGVPTLCMDGTRLASRGAMAVMSHVGLGKFVADNPDDFVEKGKFWSQNLDELSKIRGSLRERLNLSPLSQPEMLADGLEKAFRKMWVRWCEGKPAITFEIKEGETQVDKPNEIIYVTQPLLPDLKDFFPYLEKIWDNKLLTNGGPFHQQLEKALCEYLGVKHIALFANGTLALLTALQALRISGEVITTPYSFVATAHSLLWNGIRPVFVDIDPISLNMDPGKIEAAITPNTAAIMPVHCYGHPCDVERIQKIADDYNLKVIYDAAHAFGVNYKGTSLLNYGDLSVLSFHATKVFNTFEGGAIICPDAKTKQRIDHLKNFGFVDEVTVVAAGINGKMSEVNAAFGMLQLKGIDEGLAKRKIVDLMYRQRLSDIQGIHCITGTGEEIPNYSYFPILVKPGYHLTRDELYQKLRDSGVYARRYFYPLISDFPMYRGMPSSSQLNLPVATAAAKEVICLPIYPGLNINQINRIVNLIRQQQ